MTKGKLIETLERGDPKAKLQLGIVNRGTAGTARVTVINDGALVLLHRENTRLMSIGSVIKALARAAYGASVVIETPFGEETADKAVLSPSGGVTVYAY